MDASTWKTDDDVYRSFFKVVGAPEWHGKNLDALNDSIANGEINAIEIPYRLVVQHSGSASGTAVKMMNDLVDLVRDIAARGFPVEIVLER